MSSTKTTIWCFVGYGLPVANLSLEEMEASPNWVQMKPEHQSEFDRLYFEGRWVEMRKSVAGWKRRYRMPPDTYKTIPAVSATQ